MQIGLHKNIQPTEYHSWEGASASRLKELGRSPAHCRSSIDTPYEATESKIKGSATHCALLEPDEYPNRFHLFEGDRRTKAGKEDWKSLLEITSEDYILRRNTYEDVNAMAAMAHQHKAANRLLKACDEKELSMVWEYDGVICKGRIDGYSSKFATIVDIKTTTDAGFNKFKRTIWDYKYHWQAWHYREGARALGLEVDSYVIIAIENSKPYAVMVYGLLDEAIDYAKEPMERLITTYGECMKSGEWPAYSDIIEDIGLPDWVTGGEK